MRREQRAAGIRGRRSAFTLIELLVVIAIIIALAGITLLFYPKREARLAADGADRLQTYIATARSMALRDQAPRGVRLIAGNGGFRQAQFVEVPEPVSPNVPMTVNNTTPNVVTFSSGFGAASPPQAGDFLEILHGSGSVHRIVSQSGNSINLASNVPAAAVSNLTLNNNYRFIRQPQPLMGEPLFQLPDSVLIRSEPSIPRSFDNANAEIIFAPSGQVINATGGRIVLWIEDDNQVSKPTLLTIYSRTGGVAAHPIGPAGDPYAFTRDGRSSGQ